MVKEQSSKKIGSFISSIVLLIFSGLLTFGVISIVQSMQAQHGLEALGFIILAPLLIVMYIVLAILLFVGIITSLSTLGSSSKFIKIMAILILLINLALLGLNIYYLLNITAKL